jgi:phosphoglycerol transferase MdoB-like AlkP superfamily enzyme
MKFKIAPAKIDWWYWFATLIAMIIGLTGRVEGFYAVVAISAVQFIHFLVKDGFAALTTQVRLVYGGFTVLALFDPTRILFWLLLLGTVMVTFFGRCMIEVALKKMPWNQPPKPA